MHRTTWALQIFLGIYFLVTGIIHPWSSPKVSPT
jgi:hypothetical protein